MDDVDAILDQCARRTVMELLYGVVLANTTAAVLLQIRQRYGDWIAERFRILFLTRSGECIIMTLSSTLIEKYLSDLGPKEIIDPLKEFIKEKIEENIRILEIEAARRKIDAAIRERATATEPTIH